MSAGYGQSQEVDSSGHSSFNTCRFNYESLVPLGSITVLLLLIGSFAKKRMTKTAAKPKAPIAKPRAWKPSVGLM